MNLSTCYLTKNNCYISGKKIAVKGFLIHSTGANNPRVDRYVPIGNSYSPNHWNTPLPDGREVCVHGFIGKLPDGKIGSVQTLPWDTRGWHAGGSANNTHIGVEICEDALKDANYFNAVYREAVELCAYLCKTYNLNPVSPTVITHSEGHKLGIASNHADVTHWFPKFGKNMDIFRRDVAEILKPAVTSPTVTEKPPAAPPQTPENTDIPSAWARADWEWAHENALFNGGDPKSPATREQVAAVARRLFDLLSAK